jgi:hypothetical protein
MEIKEKEIDNYENIVLNIKYINTLKKGDD